MIRTIDSKSILLEIPSGFEELTRKEISDMGGKQDIKAGEMVANHLLLQNKSRHMMFEAVWRRVPFITSFASLEHVAKTTARRYKSVSPSFKNLTMVSRKIAGLDAAGFRYEFEHDDREQFSEYLIIKHNKKFYAFILTTRKQNQERDYPLFEEILDSIQLRNN